MKQKTIEKKPFLSIIIPTLNEEYFITTLLKCLSKQTYQNFEVINIDANSDDKTADITKKFRNVKSIIVKEKNVCFQRNFGAKKATGEWLVFIDADVQIGINYLNKIHNLIYKNEVDALSTLYKPNTNKPIHKILIFISSWTMYFTQFLKQPLVSEAVFIFNKSKFMQLKGFNQNLKASEGAELLQRAKKENFIFKYFVSPKYTFSMRRVEQQGILKTIANSFLIVYKMMIGKKMTKENLKNLYPMDGGKKYFQNTD